MTKLAAAMTAAATAHATVTAWESVARWRGRARAPPRIERRQVGARPEGERGRALVEERRHTLAGVGGAPGPEHPLRVQQVSLDRVVGAEELPHHLPGQGHRDCGAVVGDLARQLARRREQRLRRDDAAHEPPGQGLLGAEDTAGVDPLGGLADADEPRQEPRAAGLGHDATPGEDEADARRRGRDADVHRERQGNPKADGGAVDRRDHRLLHVEDAQGHGAAAVAMLLGGDGAAARGGAEGRAARAKIGARAERAARAGDDDGAHVVVGVGAVPRLAQLAQHRRGDGVEPVRTVQGDRADSVLDVVADLGKGRHCSIWNSIRPSATSSPGAALAVPGINRSAAMPSFFTRASRTAATRRSSSSFMSASGAGSRSRSAASFASPDAGGGTPGSSSLNAAATAAPKSGSLRSFCSRWILTVTSCSLRLSRSRGAATGVSANLIIGVLRRKPATSVRCLPISGSTSALPAANVTGSTCRSSSESPLRLKALLIARNGAATMIMRAFFKAD